MSTPRQQWEENLRQRIHAIVWHTLASERRANLSDDATDQLLALLVHEVEAAVERCNDVRHHWNSGGISWDD